MPPAARIGDMHVCPMITVLVPHVGGPISMGAATVMIGFMPAARVGDMAVCVGPPDLIAKGSPTVLIEYMMAARMGDLTAHGGTIAMGFPTVMIGEMGMGAAVTAAGAMTAAGATPPAAGATPPPAATPPAAGATPPAARLGPFASADDAARAALTAANPLSIAENREYVGVIYRDSTTGQYYATTPQSAGLSGGSLPVNDIPAGSTETGFYHTHGNYSLADGTPTTAANDAFDSEHFSGTDINTANSRANGNADYRSYLATPSGGMLVHNPVAGTINNF